MARIKFLQDDFSGYQPYEYKRTTTEEQRIAQSSPLPVIQALRGGVELAQETATAGVNLADFLAKSGAFTKSKEQLVEEAAKKRAGEVKDAMGEQRKAYEAALQNRQEQVQYLQEQQPASAPQQLVKNERQRAIDFATNLQQKYENLVGLTPSAPKEPEGLWSKAKSFFGVKEEPKPETFDYETFTKNFNELNAAIEEGKKTGLISPQDAAKLDALVSPAVKKAEAARNALEKQQLEAAQAEGKVAPPAGAETERAKLYSQTLMGELRNAGLSAPVKVQAVEPKVEQIVNRLDETKAGNIYAELQNKDPTELTTTQVQLMDAIGKKFPQFLQPAGATQVPGPAEQKAPQPDQTTVEVQRPGQVAAPVAAAPAKTKEQIEAEAKAAMPAYALPSAAKPPAQVATVPQFKAVEDKFHKDFLAGIDQRKADLAADITKTKTEKEEELKNLDKTIADYDKLVAEEKKGGTVASKAWANVLTSLNHLFPQTDKLSRDDLIAKQANLTQMITYLGDQKTLEEFSKREDVRADTIKNGLARILDATAELQKLNEVKENTGKLTADQAARYVQLQDFINVNKQDIQQFEKIKNLATADKEELKSFMDVAKRLQARNPDDMRGVQLDNAETYQQRFSKSLDIFDAQTKALIEAEVEKTKAAENQRLFDANTIKLMAAQAALYDDKDLGKEVLALLKNGQVVGIPASNITDVFNGNHKQRFYDEIVQTLFTRAKGKSEDELRLMLMRELNNKDRQINQGEKDRLAMMERMERLEFNIARRPNQLKKLAGEAAVAAEKGSPEMLQALRDEALGRAQDMAAKGAIAAEYYPARLKLTEAQTSYYANKNATEIEKARLGQLAAAAQAMTANGTSEVAADNNQVAADRRARASQGGNLYEKYFNPDGSKKMAKVGDPDPITGQPLKIAIPLLEVDYPSKIGSKDWVARSAASEDAGSEAWKAYVKGQGAGNRDLGQRNIVENRQKLQQFADSVAANKQDSNTKFDWKSNLFTAFAADKGLFNSKVALARSLPTESGHLWMEAIDEANGKLREFKAELQGKFGGNVDKAYADDIKKKREQLRIDLNKRWKELAGKKAKNLFPETAPQQELPAE